MNDPEKKTTYAAEDMVAAWLDKVDPDTGQVQVRVERDGRSRQLTFTPEPEPRFTGPDDAIGFVRQVMARLQQQAKSSGDAFRGREHRPVAVVASDGWKRASYSLGMIILPQREKGGAWALRSLVVLHELAHHLNTGIDGAIIDEHGEGFRDTMVRLLEAIGWVEIAAMLREAYRQVGLDRRHGAQDGMLARVGKLLRHAEGASTEEERDAFFAKAQELATLHSIELAVARAAQEDSEKEQELAFESVQLGHKGQHSNVRFVELMLAITRANDLRCSIRSDNTGVTLYGFQSDIDVVKALYVSLVLQMVADADAYIRSGAHRPTHGRTARAAFYSGWTDRIGDRLAEAQWRARQEAQTAAVATGRDSGSGGESPMALALVAKDVEVADYYEYMKRQHGVRGQWRGSSHVADGYSMTRGRAAADRARLRQQGQIGR